MCFGVANIALAPAQCNDIHNIRPAELNEHLRSFFLTVKKKYEPDSLSAVLHSLDRHLGEKSYPVSLAQGDEFKSCLAVLKARKKIEPET